MVLAVLKNKTLTVGLLLICALVLSTHASRSNSLEGRTPSKSPEPAASTQDTISSTLEAAFESLESSRRLLSIIEESATADDLLPAVREVISTLESSRKLLQAANVTHLREQAKTVLLASDAFGMVYTGGNFARAILALLTPMVIAGQTGAVAVDANYLLNLSGLLSQFVATLGDLLSKGARLTADGIAPI